MVVKRLLNVGLVAAVVTPLLCIALEGVSGCVSSALPDPPGLYPYDDATSRPVMWIRHPGVELVWWFAGAAVLLGLLVEFGEQPPWSTLAAAGPRTGRRRVAWACAALVLWSPLVSAHVVGGVREHRRLAARAQVYADVAPWLFDTSARDIRCVQSSPQIHSDRLVFRVDPERLKAGDARRAYREAFETLGWETHVNYFGVSAWIQGKDPFGMGPTPEAPWRIDTYVEAMFQPETGRVEMHLGTRPFYAPEYWAWADHGSTRAQ